ncbi:MAG: hypothetical protein IJF26_02080 [Clostridia bacterium]|nr:hypothetical protein [Clostridia bacterium]
MKRLFVICLAIITVASSLLLTSCMKKPVEVTPVSLGTPTEKMSFGIERSPWDMMFYEGKLYIGNGDFDDNAGPITIWCYDPETEKWENSGSVRDESVSRFTLIDGKLAATGTDPMDGWELGNYYVLENGEWKTVRTIPGAVHNFDMAEHNGKIFCSIGVEPGGYPAAVSTDGGATFTQVPFYKDGKALDTSKNTSIRTYNMFLFKDQIYTSYVGSDPDGSYYELYKYENDKFVFQKSLSGEMGHIATNQTLYSADVEFKDKYFIATGYMFITSDMDDFRYIKYPNADIVYDFKIINDKLYSLTSFEVEKGKHKICVWENSSGKDTDFKQVFYFYYDAPCVSFEYENGDFYIGIGSARASYLKNGEILKVHHPVK